MKSRNIFSFSLTLLIIITIIRLIITVVTEANDDSDFLLFHNKSLPICVIPGLLLWSSYKKCIAAPVNVWLQMFLRVCIYVFLLGLDQKFICCHIYSIFIYYCIYLFIYAEIFIVLPSVFCVCINYFILFNIMCLCVRGCFIYFLYESLGVRGGALQGREGLKHKRERGEKEQEVKSFSSWATTVMMS